MNTVTKSTGAVRVQRIRRHSARRVTPIAIFPSNINARSISVVTVQRIRPEKRGNSSLAPTSNTVTTTITLTATSTRKSAGTAESIKEKEQVTLLQELQD